MGERMEKFSGVGYDLSSFYGMSKCRVYARRKYYFKTYPGVYDRFKFRGGRKKGS